MDLFIIASDITSVGAVDYGRIFSYPIRDKGCEVSMSSVSYVGLELRSSYASKTANQD